MRSGTVILLNGAPRAGKSSIAQALRTTASGPVTTIGVDSTMAETAAERLPGIGLRPGGERPDLEDFVQQGYRALFDSIAALAERGLGVAADVGIHDWYSRPLGVWSDAAERLADLPVHVIGVRCGLETILARRAADPQRYAVADEGTIPDPILRWERAVHDPGWYDLEVDTTSRSPQDCAAQILDHVESNEGQALERHRTSS